MGKTFSKLQAILNTRLAAATAVMLATAIILAVGGLEFAVAQGTVSTGRVYYPDLVVERVSWDAGTRSVSVVVKNQGRGHVDASFPVTAYVTERLPNGSQNVVSLSSQINSSATNALGQNSTQSVTINFTGRLSAGGVVVNIEAQADAPFGVIQETFEGNNSGSIAVPFTEVNFERAAYSFNEGHYTRWQTNPGFQFSIAPALTAGTVEVVYEVVGGTATLGSDYTLSPNRTRVFVGSAASPVSRLGELFTIVDDNIPEQSETIILRISSATHPVLVGSRNIVTITIADNDAAGTLSFTPIDANGCVTVRTESAPGRADGSRLYTITAGRAPYTGSGNVWSRQRETGSLAMATDTRSAVLTPANAINGILPGATVTITTPNGNCTMVINAREGTLISSTGPAINITNEHVTRNRFNDFTDIRFTLNAAANVTVEMLRNNQLVRTVASNYRFEAGERTVRWDGTNNANNPAPAGTYAFRVRASGVPPASTGSDTFTSNADLQFAPLPPRATVNFSAPTLTVRESGGQRYYDIGITRTSRTRNDMTVEWQIVGGTATIRRDFADPGSQAARRITFAGGENSPLTANFQLLIFDDTEIEIEETIELRLVAITTNNTVIGSNNAMTVTIVSDNDSVAPILPEVNFERAVYQYNEGHFPRFSTHPTFGFTISASSTNGPVEVEYEITSSTATHLIDYLLFATTATFQSGSQTRIEPQVAITDDTDTESAETITLRIKRVSPNAVIGPRNTVTITIADNDTGPAINITGERATRNQFSDFTDITFTQNAAADVTVEMLRNNQLVRTVAVHRFEAGEHTVRWDGSDNTNNPAPAGTYAFRIRATGVPPVSTGSDTFTSNADLQFTPLPPRATVNFSAPTLTVRESDGTRYYDIGVTRTNHTRNDVTVEWQIVGGTATHPDDFVNSGRVHPVTRQITFAGGANSSVTSSVSFLIQDDTEIEPEETIELRLVAITTNNTVIGSTGTMTIIIVSDNDRVVAPPPPPIEVNFERQTYQYDEDPLRRGSSLTNVTITASAAPPEGTPVEVEYDVVGGTATQGTDYTLANSTRTTGFTAGLNLSRDVLISIIDDGEVEPAETITLRIIRAGPNAVIGPRNTVTIIINDNDEASAIVNQVDVSGNYALPERFTEFTDIQFRLNLQARVTAEILRGDEVVRTLRRNVLFQPRSTDHSMRWDGKDSAGTLVPNGTYTYRITAVGVAPASAGEDVVTGTLQREGVVAGILVE